MWGSSGLIVIIFERAKVVWSSRVGEAMSGVEGRETQARRRAAP